MPDARPGVCSRGAWRRATVITSCSWPHESARRGRRRARHGDGSATAWQTASAWADLALSAAGPRPTSSPAPGYPRS